ncbi:MAG TPA: hypothetical protein VKB23_00870 [Solirubrobacterales bacterium]|nr:hypothetical protein [Solirubrobacterales bacterium]
MQAYRYLPDPAFGTGGALNLLPSNGAGGVFHEVREVVPGPGGSVYVHYRDLPTAETYECEARHYLARLLPSGGLDTSFGIGGFATIVSPLGCQFPTLGVDAEQRPLVTWTSVGSSDVPSSTLAITRLTTAGAPDPSFGSYGVALLQIPCPGGNGADADAGPDGRLILQLGCRADESAQGIEASPFQSYLARLLPDGALDPGFGAAGFVLLPSEAGWEVPDVAAVEPDGAAILAQTTQYVIGVPQRSRLLRLRPDGLLASGYQARVERSLRRVAGLAAPQIPEDATDFVIGPGGDLLISGHSQRGGYVIGLRHDGSLEQEFGDDGYRRFATRIQYIALDRHGRLFVLGDESQRLTIHRLLPHGNRDRLVGGTTGQHLGIESTGQLADLVSLWHGRPLLYFENLGSCSTREECAEPAELQRYRFVAKERAKPARRGGAQ